MSGLRQGIWSLKQGGEVVRFLLAKALCCEWQRGHGETWEEVTALVQPRDNSSGEDGERDVKTVGEDWGCELPGSRTIERPQ